MITILSYAEALERHAEFDAVISVENPTVGMRLRYEATTGAPPQLVVQFDDVDHDRGDDFVTLPTADHLRAALDFARRHADGNLLIHCHAGKCRSTALALAVLAERLGEGREREAVEELMAMRPVALVNLVALDVADAVLGRGGALSAAWHAFERSSPDAVERRARKTEAHTNFLRRRLRLRRDADAAGALAPSP
jgi:predicted protein tyrosine phosphatase